MGAVLRSRAPGGEYKNDGQEGRADTQRNTGSTDTRQGGSTGRMVSHASSTIVQEEDSIDLGEDKSY